MILNFYSAIFLVEFSVPERQPVLMTKSAKNLTCRSLIAPFLASSTSSSLRVTTESAAGSRFDAARISLSWASFFSSESARATTLRSRSSFLKFAFWTTSWTEETKFECKSLRSAWSFWKRCSRTLNKIRKVEEVYFCSFSKISQVLERIPMEHMELIYSL